MKTPTQWLMVGLIAVGCCLAACTYRPYHPEKSEREWTTDHQACEKFVREGIRSEPDTYDNYDEMRLIRRCMREKGWQWERIDWFPRKAESAP